MTININSYNTTNHNYKNQHNITILNIMSQTLTFTLSFKDQNLPCDWVMANIVPIFKKGNCNLASNYRPISLTSTCCKVMEHIIFHYIMNHLVMIKYNIISNHHHGFRPAHSCHSPLILLTEDILRTMDAQKQVNFILLDFAKHLIRSHIKDCLPN